MSGKQYKSDLPYPEIKVECKNRQYAMCMLDNMGGSNSEMSAVNSYFYNSLITNEFPEMAQAFKMISRVEMHHLQIFGELTYLLGANPRLWTCVNSQMMYWTPKYNRYPMGKKEILSNARILEMSSIAKYECQLKEIHDKNIQEILERILIDEKIHLEIFRSFMQ